MAPLVPQFLGQTVPFLPVTPLWGPPMEDPLPLPTARRSEGSVILGNIWGAQTRAQRACPAVPLIHTLTHPCSARGLEISAQQPGRLSRGREEEEQPLSRQTGSAFLRPRLRHRQGGGFHRK